MSANSGSISSVNYLLFHLSFTVLFTIAKHAVLSQEDGSPKFEQYIYRPTELLYKSNM